jgi:hypothetical protein
MSVIRWKKSKKSQIQGQGQSQSQIQQFDCIWLRFVPEHGEYRRESGIVSYNALKALEKSPNHKVLASVQIN